MKFHVQFQAHCAFKSSATSKTFTFYVISVVQSMIVIITFSFAFMFTLDAKKPFTIYYSTFGTHVLLEQFAELECITTSLSITNVASLLLFLVLFNIVNFFFAFFFFAVLKMDFHMYL